MYRVLAVLLSAGLLFPSLHCKNLLCYYCPLQAKNKECYKVRSVCPPQEVCFTAKGNHNGSVGLMTSGCTALQRCATVHDFHYRGTNFTVTYSCCHSDLCNSASGIPAFSGLLVSLAVTAASLLHLWMR